MYFTFYGVIFLAKYIPDSNNLYENVYRTLRAVDSPPPPHTRVITRL